MTAAQDTRPSEELCFCEHTVSEHDAWFAPDARPLIEAARAYRDADATLDQQDIWRINPVEWTRLSDIRAEAAEALFSAARTFEGHVEEEAG